MFSFAMDCFLAGLAIFLFIIATKNSWSLDKNIGWGDVAYLSATFGAAIFLTSRFLMSFVLMWSNWD